MIRITRLSSILPGRALSGCAAVVLIVGRRTICEPLHRLSQSFALCPTVNDAVREANVAGADGLRGCRVGGGEALDVLIGILRIPCGTRILEWLLGF